MSETFPNEETAVYVLLHLPFYMIFLAMHNYVPSKKAHRKSQEIALKENPFFFKPLGFISLLLYIHICCTKTKNRSYSGVLYK